jgi:hypothetical protein
MSTFTEQPFDASSDGRNIINSTDSGMSQNRLDEIRNDMMDGFRLRVPDHEKIQRGLPTVELCDNNEILSSSGLDKLARQLSVGKFDEKSVGKQLEDLFSNASSFGSSTMDCLVEQLNQRLEDSSRLLKVRPEGNRMPPGSYTITLFDLNSGTRLGSVEAEGRGRK